MKPTTKKGLNKQLMRFIALALMCVIGTSSAITVAALTKDITVVDGDNRVTVSTIRTETDEILQMANISLGEYDQILRDDETSTITVLRAFNVSVTADGKTATKPFTQGTVADALRACGVTLKGDDKVQPAAGTILTAGMKIAVTRYHTLTLIADGETKTFSLAEGTIADALKAANVTVGEEDIVSIDLDEAFDANTQLTINRVTYVEEEAKEAVPYKSVSIESSDLYEGNTEVKTAGVDGERTIKTRSKLIDGEVAETEILSDEVTTAPVDEEVLVGTKARPALLSKGTAQVGSNGVLTDQNGNQVAYSTVYTGGCTAYSAYEGALTASGMPAQVGHVAVDPSIIPYGTRLYICSPDGSFVYGYAIAADTGGAMLSGHALADLYFDTIEECWQFGRRTMNVYVLA